MPPRGPQGPPRCPREAPKSGPRDRRERPRGPQEARSNMRRAAYCHSRVLRNVRGERGEGARESGD
eukprot:2701432-Pyramimonas_sp.AAC.1